VATFKLTWKRGQRTKDVARSNGTSIAGSDAMELNIDTTALTKGEALEGLDHIVQQIVAKGWPQ
jgi:hypothetical protein